MWSFDFERFQGAKLNTFPLILMFKFALVQPWDIGVCRIDLVFVTVLTVDLLSINVLLCNVCSLFCLKSSSSMLYLYALPTVSKNYVTLLVFNI